MVKLKSKCVEKYAAEMWGHLEIKFYVMHYSNVYVIQIFLAITINSFENKSRLKLETLIDMGRFKWGYPYSQMLHNIKCCNLTTKLDKKKIFHKHNSHVPDNHYA